MPIIAFTGTELGLIVRGKKSASDDPGLLDQHADCVLDDGSPIGFFGGQGAAVSGKSSGSWNSIGMNMNGFVADFERLRLIRPYYVDTALAKKYASISTLLVVSVSTVEATLFRQFWLSLMASPSTFNLLGNNCSTHANDAFAHAGIVSGGIPGLDTPNHLYQRLVTSRPKKTVSYSGYLGFTKRVTTGYDVWFEPLA